MTESNTDPNLLVDLHKLARRQDENFTTEVFANLLRYLVEHEGENRKAGRELLETLTGLTNLKGLAKVDIYTQKSIKGHGRPDIQISGGDFHVLVEVKVKANPNKRKLAGYKSALRAIKNKKTKLVLLTKRPPSSKKIPPDIHPVRWEEIAEKLTQLKETVEESTPGGYLVRELLGFFKERMLSRGLTSKRSKKSFDVWLVSISGDFREEVSNIREKTEDGCPWSAPRRALRGDLILMYRTAPDSRIQDIFVLEELAKFHPKGWGKGPTWMAPYRRVAKLERPITLENFKQRKNKKLKKLEYLLRGRQKISKYWPDLYEFILKQNSGIRKELKNYEPVPLVR